MNVENPPMSSEVTTHKSSFPYGGGLDGTDEQGWRGYKRGYLKVDNVKLKILIFFIVVMKTRSHWVAAVIHFCPNIQIPSSKCLI
jgi:hypothetical protein